MAKKPEEQMSIPGIPEVKTKIWRCNYQYQGPNYALRQGSLIIPADTIEAARIIAQGTLKNTLGDKWYNVTKITSEASSMENTEGAPF